MRQRSGWGAGANQYTINTETKEGHGQMAHVRGAGMMPTNALTSGHNSSPSTPPPPAGKKKKKKRKKKKEKKGRKRKKRTREEEEYL